MSVLELDKERIIADALVIFENMNCGQSSWVARLALGKWWSEGVTSAELARVVYDHHGEPHYR